MGLCDENSKESVLEEYLLSSHGTLLVQTLSLLTVQVRLRLVTQHTYLIEIRQFAAKIYCCSRLKNSWFFHYVHKRTSFLQSEPTTHISELAPLVLSLIDFIMNWNTSDGTNTGTKPVLFIFSTCTVIYH